MKSAECQKLFEESGYATKEKLREALLQQKLFDLADIITIIFQDF
jgi:hypothetical protein